MSRRLGIKLLCSFLAVLCYFAVHAAADQTSANFAVNAEIVAGCGLSGTTTRSGIDFGLLNFGSASAVSNSTLTGVSSAGGSQLQLQCTQETGVLVAIDGGLHLTGNVRHLALSGVANQIAYSLYLDNGFTTLASPNQAVSIAVPNSGVLNLPIYGRLTLPGSGLTSGAYIDTVQISVSW